ncbi:reverse transcriptase domain, reverse transcriptase zinc-binding domain protein [Tanacetum coccineum]
MQKPKAYGGEDKLLKLGKNQKQRARAYEGEDKLLNLGEDQSVESVRRDYFWGRARGEGRNSKPIVWAKWEKALSHYALRGLNIDSLKAMNWALLTKLWWRFWVENEALWVKSNGRWGLKGNIVLGQHWVRDRRLREQFPRVRLMRDITELCNLVQFVQLNKYVKDKYSWALSEDDKFLVKDLRGLIDKKTLGSIGRHFISPWCKRIPKNVCVFIWRLFHGRFPVCTILDDIGIDLHTLLCPSCNDVIESLDHFFALYLKVQLVCKRVFEWWGLENMDVFSVQDILNLPGYNSFSGVDRERWKSVIWSTLYITWSNRNRTIFRRNGSMIPDLFKKVQLQSFE